MIIFFRDGHSYWCDGRRFRSVNQFIRPLKPEFDSKYWLPHSLFKEYFGQEYLDFKKELGLGYAPPPEKIYPPFIEKMGAALYQEELEKLIDRWEFDKLSAGFRGREFHATMEKEAYQNGFIINPWDKKPYELKVYPKLYDNESLMENLYHLPDGVYPELLVFNKGLKLAGQADEVFIETKRKYRYVDINDHKTNGEKPSKSGFNFYSHPLHHLRDCGHVDYSLQISSYAWMLEQFGFRVRNLGYTWYSNYQIESAHLTGVDYLKRELESVFPL